MSEEVKQEQAKPATESEKAKKADPGFFTKRYDEAADFLKQTGRVKADHPFYSTAEVGVWAALGYFGGTFLKAKLDQRKKSK